MNKDPVFSVRKLDDAYLENISGGFGVMEVAAGAASPLLVSGFGCSVASLIYYYKAGRAKDKGNTADYNNYTEKAKKCAIATTPLLGAFIASACVCGMVDSPKDSKKQ